jgi:hypothetical protein
VGLTKRYKQILKEKKVETLLLEEEAKGRIQCQREQYETLDVGLYEMVH